MRDSQNQATAPVSVEEMAVNKTGHRETGEIGSALDKRMEMNILRSTREFDEIEGEWNQLLEKSEANIFQTFEWQRMWWEYFGGNDKLHILIFRNRGQLVGIAPFFLEETRLAGLYTYRILRFLACCIPGDNTRGTFSNYSPSDYLDLIVDPEYQQQVAEMLVSYLEVNKGFFDRIGLNELSEEGVMMQSVIPLIEEGNWSYEKKEREVCPRIDLPKTVNAFMYMISSKLRYKLRRAKRPVIEDNLYKVRDTKSEQEFEFAFGSLIRLHQERWNKQGYPGAFTDERYEHFLKRVSKAFLQRGWLRMKSAYDHDGNCLAVNLAYTFNNRIFDYQKAFDITSDLARHSPGSALTYFLIEDAIEEGREIFDLLRGGERYKFRLATSAPQNQEVVIHNSPGKRRVKDRLFYLINGISNIKLRISRELLLLRIHIREWGFWGFSPKYVDFMKDRFKGKR